MTESTKEYAYSEQQTLDYLERSIAQKLKDIVAAMGRPISGQWRVGPYRFNLHGGSGFPHQLNLIDQNSIDPHASDEYRSSIYFAGCDYVDVQREVDMERAVERRLPNDHDGWHRVYDASAMAIKESVAVKMTLARKHSEQYNQQVKFGVTNKTSVGASIDGVNISDDLTLTAETQFGVTSYQDVVSTKSFDETVQIDVPLGSKVSVDCDVYSSEKRIPIVESAYVDFDMVLQMGSYDSHYFGPYPGHELWQFPDGSYADYNNIKCPSIRSLLDLLEGKRDIEYPGMAGWLDKMHKNAANAPGAWDMQLAQNAVWGYEWLANRENFKVRASKTHVLYQQNAGEIVTRNVG